MAAIGVALLLPIATAAAAQGPSTEFTRWLDSIPGKHRVLLDMREPNGGFAFAWAWVWLLTAPQAYGVPEERCGRSDSTSPQWNPGRASTIQPGGNTKLGEFFKIDDPETGKPAVRNPYLPENVRAAAFRTWAMQKLIDRGVRVVACDMAIHFYTGILSKQMGLKHEDVKADWNSAVLPNVAHAPSGVVACQARLRAVAPTSSPAKLA